MVTATNDINFVSNNIDSTKFKNTSVSSISTVTSKTATATTTLSDQSAGTVKKRLESMTDEEIIQRNLKELMDKKNREERKANGRLVAVILATLVIFLAIYHAWLQKPGMLGSVLVPAVIMLSFASWVVILAKRDKARRQMFEQYLEEVALKNKQELEVKSKTKTKRSHDKKTTNETILHFENEINKELLPLIHNKGGINSSNKTTSTIIKNNDHRKHRKHRNASNSDGYSTTSSSSSKKSSSHYATKDLRVKRPSIREKIFRQTGIYHMSTPTVNATQTLVQAVINTPVPQCTPPLIGVVPINCAPPSTLIEAKRKRLQRLDALQVPTMVRMGSAP